MPSILNSNQITVFSPKTNLPMTITSDHPAFDDAVKFLKKSPHKTFPKGLFDPHSKLRRKLSKVHQPFIQYLTKVQAYKYAKNPEELVRMIRKQSKIPIFDGLRKWGRENGVPVAVIRHTLSCWYNCEPYLDAPICHQIIQRAKSERTLVRAYGVERNKEGQIVGGTLETSRNATVPLPDAIRVFKMVTKHRAKGRKKSVKLRAKVGSFALGSVEPNGDFKVACHTLLWDECNQLADRLNINIEEK